ncbi:MAG: DUF1566 domain-containing protein [bacterium]
MKVVIFVLFAFFLVSCDDNGRSKMNSEELIVSLNDNGWSKMSREELSYTDACEYCEDLKEGGISNWRLPKISELRALITGCDITEPGGSCKVNDDCLNFYSICMSDPCGCDPKPDGYSKLGDKKLLLSGSWFDDIPDCDGCTNTFWETYAAAVSFHNAAISFEKSGFVRCKKISEGDEREIECTEKPEHSQWNRCSKIKQIWDGDKWIPSNVSTYNDESSWEECRFKCDNTYEWEEKSGACVSTLEYPWTDPDTSLEWSRAERFCKWVDIENFCKEMDEGGNTDWRVPDINELRTLVTNCPLTQTGGKCEIALPFSGSESLSEECSGCNSDKSGIYSKLGDSYYFISSSHYEVHEGNWKYKVFLYINFLCGSIVANPEPPVDSQDFNCSDCRCVRNAH